MARQSVNPSILAVFRAAGQWLAMVPLLRRASIDDPMIGTIQARADLSSGQQRIFDRWVARLGP